MEASAMLIVLLKARGRRGMTRSARGGVRPGAVGLPGVPATRRRGGGVEPLLGVEKNTTAKLLVPLPTIVQARLPGGGAARGLAESNNYAG
jgi:hypothetical protein